MVETFTFLGLNGSCLYHIFTSWSFLCVNSMLHPKFLILDNDKMLKEG